jgi:hypothetical protein
MGLLFAAPAFATVTVTSPKSGSTITSPVSYAATATTTCSKGVGSMGIYVNNRLTYVVNGAKMNTTLSLAPGAYSTVVEEWDHCGALHTQRFRSPFPPAEAVVAAVAASLE